MFLMPDGIAVNLRLWARGSKKAVVDNGVTMTDPPVSDPPDSMMLKLQV